MAGETVNSIEMLRRLVAFDTTSRNSNLALIEYVQAYLQGHGVASKLVPNEDGSKANLFATVGPNVPGGVVLSGHTDVVPVDGQPWVTDPWTLTLKDGKYYGRGTCDMKAFYAIGLAMLPEFLKAPLKKPIHFALSYDEEIGCFGAHSLAARMASEVPKPRVIIIGEPTMMTVVHAHKGSQSYVTKFTGFEAHSSMTHLGVSAIHFAGEFIHYLNTVQEELEAAAVVDARRLLHDVDGTLRRQEPVVVERGGGVGLADRPAPSALGRPCGLSGPLGVDPEGAAGGVAGPECDSAKQRSPPMVPAARTRVLAMIPSSAAKTGECSCTRGLRAISRWVASAPMRNVPEPSTEISRNPSIFLMSIKRLTGVNRSFMTISSSVPRSCSVRTVRSLSP